MSLPATPNPAPTRRRLARLWLAVFGAGFTALAVLAAMAIATPAPVGDLTRLGRVSERDFGPHQPQPVVAAELLRSVPLAEADVLVVGDSFSEPGLWQSVLVRAGLRVANLTWRQHADALCDDTPTAYAAAGFRGRLIVVQSVERELGQRLRRSLSCVRSPVTKNAFTAPRPRPSIVTEAPATGWGNWHGHILSGWTAWRHARLLAQGGADPISLGAGVIVRNVADGCEVFSHTRCHQALFFDDLPNGPLAASDVAAMQTVSRRFGVPVLWVVIPNKTTAYLMPEHSAPFRRALADTDLGPDLFEFVLRRRLAVRDLYLPNDTHLSTAGQLELGQQVLDAAATRR